MPRPPVQQPTVVVDENRGEAFKDEVVETHPAWGLISAHRVSSAPGAVLFDSDIRHGHYVTVEIKRTQRRRNLMRDWFFGQTPDLIQVAMSEAQWASFVSSMNAGQGVPCTIERVDGETMPGMPYQPRLRESMDEVEGAVEKAVEKIREAFAKVEERPNKGNVRALGIAISHLPANAKFAAQSLTEHTENVVQKARADVEAMVHAKAKQLGLAPGDLDVGLLDAGDEEGDGSD